MELWREREREREVKAGESACKRGKVFSTTGRSGRIEILKSGKWAVRARERKRQAFDIIFILSLETVLPLS